MHMRALRWVAAVASCLIAAGWMGYVLLDVAITSSGRQFSTLPFRGTVALILMIFTVGVLVYGAAIWVVTEVGRQLAQLRPHGRGVDAQVIEMAKTLSHGLRR